MDRDELSSILESIRSAPSSSKAPKLGLDALRQALAQAGLANRDASAKSAYSSDELEEELKQRFLTPQTSIKGQDLVKRQVCVCCS